MQTSADRDAAIRLSASEREQQRQNIVWMLGEISKQVDVLTLQQAAHDRELIGLSNRLESARRHHEALAAVTDAFYGRSLWARVRWMVRGR